MSVRPPYPYDAGDRLATPAAYAMSPFYGLGFLSAWSNRRAAALEVAHGGNARPAPTPTPTPSQLDIRDLHDAFSRGTPTPDAYRRLASLLQRFEVTKRIHAAYNAHYRPVDAADFRTVGPYLDFAELLVAAYRLDGRLQYLNALLKCMDTLSSISTLLAHTEDDRLAALADAERDLVGALARRLGVPWPTA